MIESWVQAKDHGRVTVTLTADGEYRVELAPLQGTSNIGPSVTVLQGNIYTK